MPESTPIYGIPYPCLTDVVDAAAFQDFADAVDAALAAVNVVATEALNRPAATVLQLGAPLALAVGVTTTATYNTEVMDNDGMGNLGVANDRLTVQTAGTYLVTFNATISTNGGVLTAGSVALGRSGSILYRKKDGNPLNSSVSLNIAGVFDAAVGQTFSGHLVYAGTVAGEATLAQLSARLVNRL